MLYHSVIVLLLNIMRVCVCLLLALANLQKLLLDTAWPMIIVCTYKIFCLYLWHVLLFFTCYDLHITSHSQKVNDILLCISYFRNFYFQLTIIICVCLISFHHQGRFQSIFFDQTSIRLSSFWLHCLSYLNGVGKRIFHWQVGLVIPKSDNSASKLCTLLLSSNIYI